MRQQLKQRTGRRRMFFGVALAASIVACSLPTDDGGASAPPASQTINDYEADTMEREYADEWSLVSGDTTFVLKDNTFLLDEGSTGPITAGRVTQLSANTLRLETTMIYLDQEDFADITGDLDLSAIDSLGLLLGDFNPPTPTFTYNEWVTEAEFTTQLETTSQAYVDAYFDYIETLYANLGIDINSVIPNWQSLIAELRNGNVVDPTTLDGYFKEPQFTYRVQEEPNQRRIVTEGYRQDWSFISDIPTNVNYTTP